MGMMRVYRLDKATRLGIWIEVRRELERKGFLVELIKRLSQKGGG